MEKLLVIFGGLSPEHDVSCLSAASVIEHLDLNIFEVKCVGITREGEWLLTEATGKEIKSGAWKKRTNNIPVFLSTNRSRKGLYRWDDARNPIYVPDCLLPILHGEYGEDGSIQGLFKYADIPYIGPEIMSSAAAIDKAITKRLVKGLGLMQADYLEFKYGERHIEAQCKDIANYFEDRYPIFVKPANAGSSIGVSKVNDVSEIMNAVCEAYKHHDKLVVEEGIFGREIEVAILDRGDGELIASAIGEIINDDKFYSFDEKYKDSIRTKIRIVEDLSDEQVHEIQEQAKKVFRALECKGLSRVDFFYTNEGEICFNEINTMPGFTEHSMYPKLIMDKGIRYTDMITALVDNAIK